MGPASLTATMLGVALQASAMATPLQPIGKWTLAYEPDACVLSRDFASGPDKVTLAITPPSLGNRVALTIVTTDPASAAPDRGIATIVVDTHRIDREYASVSTGPAHQRVTRTALYRPEMARLAQAASVTLPTSWNRSVTLAPTGISSALKAAETCIDDLQKAEGLASEVVNQTIGNAIPIGWDAWFTPDDYPLDAIRNETEADSVIAWIVDLDGRVSDCRAMRTAGSEIFDAQACRVVTTKGRYLPPTDATGRPATSRDGRRIRWRLPK